MFAKDGFSKHQKTKLSRIKYMEKNGNAKIQIIYRLKHFCASNKAAEKIYLKAIFTGPMKRKKK
jgi:hypothetical protein